MKISLRFLYLLPILAVFATDRAFTEFVFPDQTAPLLAQYGQVLQAAAVGLTMLCYRALAVPMRRWLLLLLAALGALALESYAGWHSWIVYPHVFSKLMVLFYAFAIYGFHRRFGLPPWGLLMAVLLLGLFTSLVVYHPNALSLSAFLDNERGFGSTSAMLLVLPTLYYLNHYMSRGGLPRLLAFFMGGTLVIFLQHRSVWVALGVALALNAVLLALGRVAGARLSSARLLPMAVLPLLALLLGGLLALNDPHVVRKLEASIDDIMHPNQQGTGSWRLQQLAAYRPYLDEYPLAGMRLKGFELPVQFYTLARDGGSQVQVWKDRTGHHFHSFYVDRLFYFGIAGLLLTLLVPVLLLARRLLSPVPLAPTTAALVVFALSELVYGISYDWPVYFYGLLGLALAAAAETSRVAARAPVRPALPAVPIPYFSPPTASRHAHAAPAARP